VKVGANGLWFFYMTSCKHNLPPTPQIGGLWFGKMRTLIRHRARRLAGTYGFATSLLSPGASIAVDNGLQLHPAFQQWSVVSVLCMHIAYVFIHL